MAAMEVTNFKISASAMADHQILLQQVDEKTAQAEKCINQLMTDEANQQISNNAQLLDKMLQFQETLSNAKLLLSAVEVDPAD